ncbi:putative peptidase S8 family protein [Lyophyllum shimeji]|uniref:Peptidase S8 family protein n=1 Tax=Lyophyllum shimeji TaxID=47721 RepID=A0A9P3PD54_LYOSH|nr:putative peptidase S8 family protein [Lyophyllum shimeji]
MFRLYSSIYVLSLLPILLAALPQDQKSILRSKEAIPGRYIVKLKSDTANRQALPALSGITHRWSGWNGFAGNFSSETLHRLLASPEVEFVEEDGITSIPSESKIEPRSTQVVVTQTDATWGLARISQDAKLSNQNPNALFTYNYGVQAGQGVDIYVLDTGVYIGHSDFGGRAGIGITFGGYPDTDGNGHGTHCAATAAGTKYGVAKLASIISVKVLSDQGSGAISDIISGIDWVMQSSASSGRPSVILAPFGGSASTSLDNAVVAATNAGVHFVTTAGNSNTDAANFSPGRVPAAITVAASTIADAVSTSSNSGSVIDLFAPGQNVLSAWIGSPTASAILSGGSSAAAHVAGLAAYLLSVIGTNITVETALETTSVKNVLTGVPPGTANRLASNNVTRLGITIL